MNDEISIYNSVLFNDLILSEIRSYLSFKDKLRVRVTCKLWYEIFSKGLGMNLQEKDTFEEFINFRTQDQNEEDRGINKIGINFPTPYNSFHFDNSPDSEFWRKNATPTSEDLLKQLSVLSDIKAISLPIPFAFAYFQTSANWRNVMKILEPTLTSLIIGINHFEPENDHESDDDEEEEESGDEEEESGEEEEESADEEEESGQSGKEGEKDKNVDDKEKIGDEDKNVQKKQNKKEEFQLEKVKNLKINFHRFKTHAKLKCLKYFLKSYPRIKELIVAGEIGKDIIYMVKFISEYISKNKLRLDKLGLPPLSFFTFKDVALNLIEMAGKNQFSVYEDTNYTISAGEVESLYKIVNAKTRYYTLYPTGQVPEEVKVMSAKNYWPILKLSFHSILIHFPEVKNWDLNIKSQESTEFLEGQVREKIQVLKLNFQSGELDTNAFVKSFPNLTILNFTSWRRLNLGVIFENLTRLSSLEITGIGPGSRCTDEDITGIPLEFIKNNLKGQSHSLYFNYNLENLPPKIHPGIDNLKYLRNLMLDFHGLTVVSLYFGIRFLPQLGKFRLSLNNNYNMEVGHLKIFKDAFQSLNHLELPQKYMKNRIIKEIQAKNDFLALSSLDYFDLSAPNTSYIPVFA